MKKIIYCLSFLFAFIFASCETGGCTDPLATNFDDESSEDDGSCVYANQNLAGNYYYSSSCINIDTFIIIPLVITAGAEPDEIILNDMEFNTNLDFLLTLVGDSLFLNQQIGDTIYAGYGKLEAPGNHMTFWYEKCLVGSDPCQGDECALLISK
jgi:hypothetical protein